MYRNLGVRVHKLAKYETLFIVGAADAEGPCERYLYQLLPKGGGGGRGGDVAGMVAKLYGGGSTRNL